jgi:hypothetical protein
VITWPTVVFQSQGINRFSQCLSARKSIAVMQCTMRAPLAVAGRAISHGAIHFSNYLKLFERCRTEWLGALGVDQSELAL